MKRCPVLAKFEVATRSTLKEEMHLKENTLFDFDLEVTHQNNALEPRLHHVTDEPASFEVAMSNSLRGDALTRKYMI